MLKAISCVRKGEAYKYKQVLKESSLLPYNLEGYLHARHMTTPDRPDLTNVTEFKS